MRTFSGLTAAGSAISSGFGTIRQWRGEDCSGAGDIASGAGTVAVGVAEGAEVAAPWSMA